MYLINVPILNTNFNLFQNKLQKIMIHINENAIVGQTFTVLDPNLEYTCIGYGQNETFLVVGSYYDATANQSQLKTFKLSDVKFVGRLYPKV